MRPSLDKDQATAIVQRLLNEIYDPCGLAHGVQFGMVDMGLIRDIDVQRVDHGWTISLHCRLTTPGCLYLIYFENEIRNKLRDFPQLEALIIEWDDSFDWTPEAMSDSSRLTLKQRRDAVLGQNRHGRVPLRAQDVRGKRGEF